MLTIVKIPEARKPILIGSKGVTKRRLEKKTKTKIKIGDDVEIEGDAINVVTAENVVKAIGRGFSPDKAEVLCKEDYALLIITISEDKKELRRIKARLIGSGGKVRRDLEIMTGTMISVYGKTVSIIGSYEKIEKARRAVEKLIKGTSHKIVYKSLKDNSGDEIGQGRN